MIRQMKMCDSFFFYYQLFCQQFNQGLGERQKPGIIGFTLWTGWDEKEGVGIWARLTFANG